MDFASDDDTVEPPRSPPGEAADGGCALCGRVTKRGLTKHHLIPRTCHSNKWFRKRFTREQMRETIGVCRDCHTAIHRLAPKEKELGRYFNTPQKLREHPQLSVFLAWVRKQR